MSRLIFVTATDTCVGKTWVTKHLLEQSLAKGHDIQALKPIASGIEASGLNEDVESLMAVQSSYGLEAINFHTFQTPVAPALAGQVENTHISSSELLQWIKQREAKAGITLIEGVGGLMAPLIASESEQWLVSDWLIAMPEAEVILVMPLRLGCMSQVFVHCHYLESIQRMPKWVVLNDLDKTGSGEETKQLIEVYLHARFDKIPQVVCVQQADDLSSII